MLGFLCTPQFWGEVAKMAAQFAGATLIAWLAVRWALGRYKTEKAWDRRATEIFGILDTLTDLEDLVGDWLEEEIQNAKPADDGGRGRARFEAARARIRQAAAISRVVLPERFEKLFQELSNSLDYSPEDDYAAAYQLELSAIRKVRDEIATYGKVTMRLGSEK